VGGILMAVSRPSPALVFARPSSAADEELCARFGIARAEGAGDEQWQLARTAAGALELRTPVRDGPLRIELDLQRGDLARRLATARREQPLPRAVGLHRRPAPPAVFDATAGLGRDALLLARLGCAVTACERQPALAALLLDAAVRSGLEPRLLVICGDAAAALAGLPAERRPAVVYLDPMFASAGRSQVKKEMQVCRLLAGDDGDPSPLLHRAFAAATDRVVVKRHPHLPPLRPSPSFTVDGERVRFDVYLQPGAATDR
jgi:16S rRNA (guanine1516-N2)-methyltransferase